MKKAANFVVLVVVAAAVCAAATTTIAPRRQPESPARDLYESLNNLRVDGARVYTVRDIALRRDAVRIWLTEGKLAFFAPLQGRIFGAVFTGRGRVLVAPRDPVEKFSIARFLSTPLVDEPFSKAYLRFTDQTVTEIEAELKKSSAAADAEFSDAWNPTVANLNPLHSLRTMCDLLASDPLPYFYMMLLGDHAGRFDVMVDERREEQVLLGRGGENAGGHYYDLWTSFPGEEGEGVGARVVMPTAYKVDTSIAADLSLEGHTTMTLKAVRSGERVVSFHISRALTVESITGADGKPLPFFQNEELSHKEIVEKGNDSFLVVLPEATRAGQEFELQAAYRGSVISDAGNGVYFVGARGSWYPHIAATGNFANFDLSFRWPHKLTLVATGRKTEQHEEGDWRSGRWQSKGATAVAGFNLGEFANEQVDAGGVRVSVHANRQLERAIVDRLGPGPGDAIQTGSIGLGIPSVPEPPGAMAIPPTVAPNPAATLKQLARDVADSVRELERWNGTFPYERLEISPIPGSFGQGWPGLLYLSTLSFLPPEAAGRAGVAPREQQMLSELMPYHEVAHQWWGDMVEWSTYHDEWIEESLANYCALLYLDNKKPGGRTLSTWMENFRNDLLKKVPGTAQTYDDVGPLVLGQRLNSSIDPGGFDHVVYPKGTWVVHMLRMMLRDPAAKEPDARFAALLHGLLEEHGKGTLSTAEFQKAVEHSMTPAMALEGGHSMDWFFDEWVRGTGIPHYEVEYKVVPQGQSFLIRGMLKQSKVPDNFLVRVPLYAAGGSGKPALLGYVTTGEAETAFQFKTRTNPKRVLIDPNQMMLWREK